MRNGQCCKSAHRPQNLRSIRHLGLEALDQSENAGGDVVGVDEVSGVIIHFANRSDLRTGNKRIAIKRLAQ
jgi:hypothetical protein